MENDIKKYDEIDQNRIADVIRFDAPEEVEQAADATKDGKSKAEISNETAGGKTTKEPRYMKPKVATSLPNKKEYNLTKARLITFEQLYEFNNLFLNKSFLRKRTRAAEQDIYTL